MKFKKELFEDLNKEISKVSLKLDNLKNSLKILQEECEHDWKYDGHGHKYDFYTCTICGTTKEE